MKKLPNPLNEFVTSAKIESINVLFIDVNYEFKWEYQTKVYFETGPLLAVFLALPNPKS